MRKVQRLMISLLALGLLGASFAAAPAQVMASGSLTVRCTGSDYTSIGAALSAAPLDHATITVCGGAGNYTESVTISGFSNLKVIGKFDPILNPATAGYVGPIVYVTGSTNVTLTGLVIDGNGQFSAASGSMGGIEWRNSSGTISGNTIRRIRHTTLDSDWNGIGILVDNSGLSTLPVTIKTNTVFDYQNVGIKVSGAVKPSISDNLVRGWTVSGQKSAGIWLLQVSDGASVSKNTVISDWGPQNLVPSSGILVYKTSHAKVTNNTVNGVWFGIYLYDNVSGVPDANYNLVSANTLSEVYEGIEMYAENAASSVDHNKISGNKITNHVSGSGLSHYAIYLDSNAIGAMDSNAITGNKIYGDFLIPIFQVNDTGTTGVSPQTNTIGLIAPPGP